MLSGHHLQILNNIIFEFLFYRLNLWDNGDCAGGLELVLTQFSFLPPPHLPGLGAWLSSACPAAPSPGLPSPPQGFASNLQPLAGPWGQVRVGMGQDTPILLHFGA